MECTFSFDPNTDDIEVFLRNVQETAKQLEYSEATVVNMIKSKMPLAKNSSLYDIHDLERVVSRYRDMYAKSNESTAESSNVAGGAAPANPFTQIKDEFFYMADGGTTDQKAETLQAPCHPTRERKEEKQRWRKRWQRKGTAEKLPSEAE